MKQQTNVRQQPKRWQDDSGFVNWLLDVRYAEEAENKIKPFVSLGMVLYMYEAYSKGKENQRKELIPNP
jgi:hypothetical protein